MSTSKKRKLPKTEESPQRRSISPPVTRAAGGSRDSSPFSIEDVQDDDDDRPPARTPTQPVEYSYFWPAKRNFHRSNNGVLRLKLEDGERLVILGTYGFRVHSGEVTIYGASFKASSHIYWVHAPQSHALPAIRCADDAKLDLLPYPSAKELKSLGKLSPLFRKLWWESPSPTARDQSSSSGDTFGILYTSEDGPKKAILQDLKPPWDWNRELWEFVPSKDSRPSSVMITGPKSSGKSTFGKLLLNRLLTRAPPSTERKSQVGVAVLDLDPGQPEYCMPGHVALVLITKPVLSPSFCRPVDIPGIRTVRSHALASLSPASDPSLYIEMAVDLVTHYRNTLGSYPLIINTPGWIQGTGLDLLLSLVRELRPSDVYYMSQNGPAEAVAGLEGACNTARFTTLLSQPGQGSSRTAINLRSMHTMAHFHAVPPSQEREGLGWFQRPLTTMVPWQVRFRGDNRGIFGVLCYDFQTQPDFVADAINGSLLTAVEVESAGAFRGIGSQMPVRNEDMATGSPMEVDADDGDQTKSSSLSLVQDAITTLTPEGIPFIDTSHGLTLDPRYSRSLGLVLVRGIDTEKGDLHLLGHVSTSQVEDVKARGGHIVLVSGKFDPPSWAYTEDFYFQSKGDDGDVNEGLDSNNQGGTILAGPESSEMDVDDTSYSSVGSVPWIEALSANQKRGVGSKVWRVRRDLGRGGNPGD
ncbi:hypothetical protein GGS20DRAFT_576395 [Poronia punctata]|nr:hypothetical protein GGS20DRAFT_576395 [Poronia punctata]